MSAGVADSEAVVWPKYNGVALWVSPTPPLELLRKLPGRAPLVVLQRLPNDWLSVRTAEGEVGFLSASSVLGGDDSARITVTPSGEQAYPDRPMRSAFRPPVNVLDWLVIPPIPIVSSYARWLYEDFMGNRFIFIFMLLMPPGWAGHALRLWHYQFGIRPFRHWVQQLIAERGAVAMEQVTYLGGHPLLPIPEQGALFVRSEDLRLELKGGACVEIPLDAIGQPSSYSREQAGLFVTSQVGSTGIFLTNEVLHRTDYFVELPFQDDKGYDNVLRLACGQLIGPELLMNLIVSARYQHAPAAQPL